MKLRNIGKIYGAGVALILLFAMLTTMLLPTTININVVAKDGNLPRQPNGYTHTVLVEACTATWLEAGSSTVGASAALSGLCSLQAPAFLSSLRHSPRA